MEVKFRKYRAVWAGAFNEDTRMDRNMGHLKRFNYENKNRWKSCVWSVVSNKAYNLKENISVTDGWL